MAPDSITVMRLSICRMITSMCLSWIATPCERYTSWTSRTRCSCTSRGPMMRSTSCGFTAPEISWVPASTESPSDTSGRERRVIGYSFSSPPSSGTMTIRRPAIFAPLRLLDPHPAGRLGDRGHALGHARLEQLGDTGQTVRDVLTGDPAGVERPHGQLGTRLADRLGGDDADRLTDVHQLAGRERAAVAGGAGAERRLAGQHRAELDVADAGRDQLVDAARHRGRYPPLASTVRPPGLMTSSESTRA